MVHKDEVYKYIVDKDEDKTMNRLERRHTILGNERSQYQLPIDENDFGLKSFLVFPMLIFPMKVIEARQCL